MVNEAVAEMALKVEDYLCPLTTIRDTLLRNDVKSISVPKLRALLAYHRTRISGPWQPFGPADQSSRERISKNSVPIPRTGATLNVDAATRRLALKLSDAANLNEVDAVMLIKSYFTYSLDDEIDEEKTVERLILWFAEESLAAPQIALAVLRMSDDEGPLGQLAYDVKVDAIGDPEKYIEGMFRAFSRLAQEDLDEKKREQDPLFWATHKLRTQETLLTLLFVTLYQNPKRSAGVSEALIRGSIISYFGTLQADRDVWEEDPVAMRLALRIRDLMVFVAIESLCLGQIISPPPNLFDDGRANTLIQSAETISSIHGFLSEYSNDLSPHHPEPAAGTVPLPLWPMPIICLVWSIILRFLPPDSAPSVEEGSVTWQDMAIRALRLPSGLFPWLETVLIGPLLESGDAGGNQEGLYFRKVFKDVLIGLTELVQLESITDKQGLYRTWEMLFSGGTSTTSSLSAADYWIADFPHEKRRAILDHSHFPYQPINLPRVLSALTGADVSEGLGTDPGAQVHHYFSNLPTFTHAVDPTWVKSLGRSEGVEIVEAAQTIVLPGGEGVPRGSKGLMLSNNGSSQVMWINQIISGWSILLEILYAAAGLRPMSEKARPSAEYPEDSIHLSVRDLDIQMSAPEILAAGIKFLRSILQSTPYIKAAVITDLNPRAQFSSGQVLLDIAITVLHQTRMAELAMDVDVVSDAVDIVEALITAPSSNVWPALRASGFFEASSKRRGSLATLIQSESVKGQHTLTVSVLRLVHTLVVNSAHVPESDTVLLTSATKLVFADIWSAFSGWMYDDVARKYELSELVMGIFETILAHPINPVTGEPTPAARVLIDLFITLTSPLTYRPIVDAVTQSNHLVPRLILSRRQADAELVVKCLDETVSFLATLLRTAALVGSPANALPKSLFGSPVLMPSEDRIQLVDALFDLSTAHTAQTSNVLSVLKTLRTFLEVTSGEAHKPSLASMMRSPQKSCSDLVKLMERTDDLDVKAAVWHLLATMISTQPGCVIAAVGTITSELQSPMKDAVKQAEDWESWFIDAPHTLAAVISYIQCAVRSAGADDAIAIVRKNEQFWQGIFDLSTRIVPAPPSFALSMHSEDFVVRIRRYAYCVQAKANATALLAAELAYAASNDTDEEPETKARELVLSLFRNEMALQEAGLMGCHTSCVPELHEEQERKIVEAGGNLKQLRTQKTACEREFGNTYLYDGVLVVPESSSKQAVTNLALDLLNLNWSMLDADMALTRSFRLLAESIASWTEGDQLAMNASLRAAITLAETVTEEYREGDVMLSIQVERLSILAVLLETALDPQEEGYKPNMDLVHQLAAYVYSIINSRIFPPIVSLRHRDLPPIHQPALRILYLVLQTLSVAPPSTLHVAAKEAVVDAGTVFALESADIVLDSIVRGVQPALVPILSMIVGVICEISKLSSTTPAWLDRVHGVNLVGRSLDVLVRSRVIDGQVPLHLSSILLLHLTLASNPSSAEKLAVSGILPAYSDNVFIAEAELGRIEAPPRGSSNTIHSAWCGMLLVVNALLATLPDAATFTRTDVVPFLRVSSNQMARAMSWDGETALSLSALEEMELVTDVYFGVACALGPKSLHEFAIPALGLLRGIRFALSHPRMLSTLFVPVSEEEKANLEKELATIEEEKDVDLVDVKRTPIIAGRTTALLRATRTTVLTLVVLTRAWELLRETIEPDHLERYILLVDEASGGTASDPVGIVNDIYVIVQSILERLPSLTPTLGGKPRITPSANATQVIRDIASQLSEACGLISFTQLALRHTLLAPEDQGFEQDNGMDLDGDTSTLKRRLQGGSKDAMVLRELVGDLRGMLIGEGGMMGVLRGMADKLFGSEEA